MPHSAVSDLGLHCLPVSHKNDAMLKRVKIYWKYMLMVNGSSNEDMVFFSEKKIFILLVFCFVALRPKSTAMVMVGRSVHLTTLFPLQA